MLDHDRCRLGKLPDQVQGAVEIEQIVVRKFFAVQRLGGRDTAVAARRVNVESRLLVRILAITQRQPALELKA